MLVSALTRKAATSRVQLWLSQQEPAGLVISDWVLIEFASALSVKIRMNQLRMEDHAKAVSLFTRLRAESLDPNRPDCGQAVLGLTLFETAIYVLTDHGQDDRGLTVVPVSRSHFLAAAQFAEQHGLGLRAGDALHVSVAAELGARICILDQRLAEAATTLGVSADLV